MYSLACFGQKVQMARTTDIICKTFFFNLEKMFYFHLRSQIGVADGVVGVVAEFGQFLGNNFAVT
jgi:hypothetical protein